MNMKQKFQIGFGIVSLVIFMTIISVTVSALSFDMELKLFQNISTCPTILQDTPPLSKDDIPVYITNFYEYPDTFHLSLNLPQGWSGFVDPDFFVDTNERKQVDPLWITVPDVDPGIYQVEIIAVSGQTGDVITKRFDIEVLSCHSVQMNIEESYKEVCKEKVNRVTFKINITNTGKDAETFDIIVLESGKIIDWADIGLPSITLNPEETKETEVTLELPEDIEEGIHEFTIKVKSQTSYAFVVKTFKLNVRDCYDFNVFLRPHENEVCLGDSVEYSLRIDNLGMADAFKIYTAEWVSVDKVVNISEKGSKDIIVNVTPNVKGKSTFTISIESVNDKKNKKDVKGSINALECRDVAVIISPSNVSVCSGEKVSFEIIVKNTGSIDEEIELSADIGKLKTDKLFLNPKEVKSIELIIDTSEFTGKKTVVVSAKTGKVVDKTTADIFSESCYSSEFYIEPKVAEICPCGKAEFTAVLKNTGKLPDNYTILFNEIMQNVSLDPNETKIFKYTVPVSCDMRGVHFINVSAISKHFSYSDSAKLHIKNISKCYSINLSNKGEIEVEVSKAVAEEIKVKNTGEMEDTFTFIVEGPSWLYLEPTSLTLKDGEEDYIYLYVSPPIETVPNLYTAKIIASSKYSNQTFKLNINVLGEAEKITGRVVGKNVTIGPTKDKGITLKASLNYTEENYTVTKKVESWKPIAIGVITIIIIMILIIRFVTLAK